MQNCLFKNILTEISIRIEPVKMLKLLKYWACCVELLSPSSGSELYKHTPACEATSADVLVAIPFSTYWGVLGHRGHFSLLPLVSQWWKVCTDTDLKASAILRNREIYQVVMSLTSIMRMCLTRALNYEMFIYMKKVSHIRVMSNTWLDWYNKFYHQVSHLTQQPLHSHCVGFQGHHNPFDQQWHIMFVIYCTSHSV